MNPVFFGLLSLLGILAVASRAFLAGNRFYALFAGMVLGTHSAIVCAVFGKLGMLQIVALLLQILALVHYFRLIGVTSMRPRWYRLGVSIPALWFVAGSILALPWGLALSMGFDPPLVWLPWALAAMGLPTSLRHKAQDVNLVLDGRRVRGLRRLGHGLTHSIRPLRVVQITDPHLGPFMPVERLRAVCQRAVEADPDLVLLTGDYLTMESNTDAAPLTEALGPLQALAGRCFAIRGNHDLDSPQEVATALEANGVRLLIDEAARADTPLGPIQVIGLDWHWRDRSAAIRAVLGRYPRVPGVPRLVMLHDPAAFRLLDDGQADLVFSGHTHGGQIGLFDMGLKRSVLSLTKIPDHGFWGMGHNRLYVHRGTGHYGFPLRLGVPGEEGIMRLHFLAGA